MTDGTTLLSGGLVYGGRHSSRADVLIVGDRIADVAPGIEHPAARRVDATGLVIAPGFVDVHVHLREPGFAHKETIRTGTAAAAAGGFTTVCAMPNLRPTPDSRAHLDVALAALRASAQVEVIPYGTITREEAGQALSDFEAMIGDCAGFSDDGRGVQSDAVMEDAMRRVAALGGLICVHCEVDALVSPGGCVHDGAASRRFGLIGIPGESEWRQVARDLQLVARTGVRYHVCHVSTQETVALVREAKAQGLPVTAECTPHQLALCEDDIDADDGRFKMNPPLRSHADRESIVQGLIDGTIDCVATDHAPHTAAEKALGLAGSAFGVVGLETAFSACYTALVQTGLCSLDTLLERMTQGPARVIGRTAMIAPGEMANLVLLDPQSRWTVRPQALRSMGHSTPFAGRTLQGRVVATWLHGRPVYDAQDIGKEGPA